MVTILLKAFFKFRLIRDKNAAHYTLKPVQNQNNY